MRAVAFVLFALSAILGLLPWPAAAADLSFSLRTPAGQPVRDAVIAFRPSAPTPGPKVAGPYVMTQENIQFHPFVLVVPVGADVSFPNHDKVRHHVYSFSPAKRFELKLYGRDETRSVHFDKPGVVALGCNIHDTMSAYIDVMDTPYVAKTDERGEATLSDLPEGPGVLTLWQPYLKAPRNEQTHAIAVSGTARLAYVLDLRAPPAAMAMPMGQ
ncbi:MAG TPA: methylamine utilization protein [Caulobacteraceae bacterium]|nr:methylamine utilization protein [Caulobacteraceae bacterium]